MPHSDGDDVEVLAQALHLETTYWESFKNSVANGIAIAFGGE